MLAAQKPNGYMWLILHCCERNLALPMHFLARLLPGRRDFWRNGALWGLAAQAGLEPFMKKSFLVEQAFGWILKHNKAHL